MEIEERATKIKKKNMEEIKRKKAKLRQNQKQNKKEGKIGKMMATF
jgi:hypothetical protein